MTKTVVPVFLPPKEEAAANGMRFRWVRGYEAAGEERRKKAGHAFRASPAPPNGGVFAVSYAANATPPT